MANSDNVLRGGLTPKHVDVPELMRVLDFSAGDVPVLTGDEVAPGEWVYPTPTTEFRLSRLELGGRSPSSSRHAGPQVLLTISGSIEVTDARADVLDRAAGSLGVDRRRRRRGAGQRDRHGLPGDRRAGFARR